MKKYQVISNLSQSSLTHQNLCVFDMDYNKSSSFAMTINHSTPKLSAGDIVKTYNHRTNGSTLATSYEPQNQILIEIHAELNTSDAIKQFCDNLAFPDNMHFNIDIAHALIQKKITPTLNKYKNLELFLNMSRQK